MQFGVISFRVKLTPVRILFLSFTCSAKYGLIFPDLPLKLREMPESEENLIASGEIIEIKIVALGHLAGADRIPGYGFTKIL